MTTRQNFKPQLFLQAVLTSAFRVISRLLPVSRNKWIVGGDRKKRLQGNSLYFYDYVRTERPDIRVIWISRSDACVTEARQRGGEAHANFSLAGLYHVLTAQAYFFSIDPSDILFVQPRRTVVVNLWHGSPFKRIVYDALGQNGIGAIAPPTLLQRLATGVTWPQVSFHVTTSAFFQKIFCSAFRSDHVLITGQARDDHLCGERARSREATLRDQLTAGSRKVVTYLPTHRKFGKGAAPPLLLRGRDADVVQRLGPDVSIITKQHSLTSAGSRAFEKIDQPVMEFPEALLEAQDLLLLSDVLVTDYSSVFVDYLLLDRPIVFYWFDRDTLSEADCYVLDEKYFPGPIAKTEEELLRAIQEALIQPEKWQSQRATCRQLYQAHTDGRNCERIADAVRQHLIAR